LWLLQKRKKNELSKSHDRSRSPPRFSQERSKSPTRSPRRLDFSRSKSPDRHRDRRSPPRRYRSRSPPPDRRSPGRYRDRRSPPPRGGGYRGPPERRNRSPEGRELPPREPRNPRPRGEPYERERPGQPKRRERPASPAWSHDKYSVVEAEKPPAAVERPKRQVRDEPSRIISRDDPNSWEPGTGEQPREDKIKASTRLLGMGLAKRALGSVDRLPAQQGGGIRISRDNTDNNNGLPRLNLSVGAGAGGGNRRMIIPTGGMRADEIEFEGIKIVRASDRPSVVEPSTKRFKRSVDNSPRDHDHDDHDDHGIVERHDVIQILDDVDDITMSVQIESDPIPPSNVKFTVTISADLNAETPKKTYHRPQPSSSSSSPHKIPRIINNAPSPIIPEDSRTIHNEIVDSSSSSSLSSSASAIAYPYSSMKSSTYPKYPTSTTGYYQSPKIHRSPYGVRKPPFRNQTLILKPGTTEATSDSNNSSWCV